MAQIQQRSILRRIPRQTGHQARAASNAREPPPYSRFEPSGQNHEDDDSDFEEFNRLLNARVVRVLAPGHDRAFDEFSQVLNAGRAELRAQRNQLASTQNPADNDIYSDVSQYFQLLSTGQDPLEGQLRIFPDLLEVHDEWLRTIERN